MRPSVYSNQKNVRFTAIMTNISASESKTNPLVGFFDFSTGKIEKALDKGLFIGYNGKEPQAIRRSTQEAEEAPLLRV